MKKFAIWKVRKIILQKDKNAKYWWDETNYKEKYQYMQRQKVKRMSDVWNSLRWPEWGVFGKTLSYVRTSSIRRGSFFCCCYFYSKSVALSDWWSESLTAIVRVLGLSRRHLAGWVWCWPNVIVGQSPRDWRRGKTNRFRFLAIKLLLWLLLSFSCVFPEIGSELRGRELSDLLLPLSLSLNIIKIL